MNESVALAKDVDTKKASSSTHESDERIHRAQNEPEQQLGSLGDVIDSIRSNGAVPSVESIAAHLSSMYVAQRAPVLLALQQTHGNQYVQRVVAEIGIQAKLVVGQSGDVYEREADRVADEVMQTAEPAVQQHTGEEEMLHAKTMAEQIMPPVQRQIEPEEEEEEEEEEIVQTEQASGQTSQVDARLEAYIHSLAGSGQPLHRSVRNFFEPRFNHDFGKVRIHTDARAAESAQVMNARAYTVGQDIVFNRGQYAEKTPAGQRLIAHELSHVIQQGESKREPLGELKLTRPRDRTERVAVDAADSVAQDQRFAVSLHGTTQIAREEALDAGVSDRSGQIECVRRLGGCPQDRPGGIPTEEDILAYNEECRRETDYTGDPLQAEDLQCEGPEEAAPVPAPAPSAPTPLHVAGCADPDPPYKIIRIAWTLDDGPTDFTGGMRQRLGERGGTWFIMRGLLGEGDELQRRLQNLVELQNQQHHEFAIHSMHLTQDHGAWFPVQVSQYVPQVYDSTAQAMQELTDFAGLLRGAGLTIHFVRLPGGLISEVSAYLESVGVQGLQRRSIADRIILGEDVTEDAPAAQPVYDDYQTLQSTLSTLGLHLWGGGTGTPLTSGQSWEAESSGSGLTDDVTNRFNRLVGAFGRVHRPRSLIVLAHDTNQDNVDEVERDVQAMETYAGRQGVRVEYYTLSDLFRVVRGEEP